MVQTKLPTSDSLHVIQNYIKQVLIQRGFADETFPEKVMLLTEEIGELARGIRKYSSVKMSATTSQSDVAEEAADVLILLLDICNALGIDLYEAFVAKEKVNQKRSWH